jgi:hypothetical protein
MHGVASLWQQIKQTHKNCQFQSRIYLIRTPFTFTCHSQAKNDQPDCAVQISRHFIIF